MFLGGSATLSRRGPVSPTCIPSFQFLERIWHYKINKGNPLSGDITYTGDRKTCNFQVISCYLYLGR